MNTHIRSQIHVEWMYAGIRSVCCKQGYNSVYTRECIMRHMVGFLSGGPPDTACLVTLNKLNMGCIEVLCPLPWLHEHRDLRRAVHDTVSRASLTLCHILPRTMSCPSLARTALLHCVLLLTPTEPGLPVAQCTRSTLFIWYHKSPSQRDVFLCLVPRSHSVFFIFVTVTAFFARTVVCQSLLRTVWRSCSSSAMYCTNTCTQCVSEYCPRPTL